MDLGRDDAVHLYSAVEQVMDNEMMVQLGLGLLHFQT